MEILEFSQESVSVRWANLTTSYFGDPYKMVTVLSNMIIPFCGEGDVMTWLRKGWSGDEVAERGRCGLCTPIVSGGWRIGPIFGIEWAGSGGCWHNPYETETGALGLWEIKECAVDWIVSRCLSQQDKATGGVGVIQRKCRRDSSNNDIYNWVPRRDNSDASTGNGRWKNGAVLTDPDSQDTDKLSTLEGCRRGSCFTERWRPRR